MSDPRHFSKATMREAYIRANGNCEACTAPLRPGHTHYDHIIPWAISRDSTAKNAAVLYTTCHRNKTSILDIPIIAKMKRVADSYVGIRKIASRPFPAGRNSGFKRTMRGGIVARMNLAQKLRQLAAVKARREGATP